MWALIQKMILRWLKRQFHGNPLVEDTGPYLHKVGHALSVGAIGALVCVGLMVLFSIIFIIGTLYGWF